MNYVFSTLTADQLYTVWGKAAPGGAVAPEHQILIKGGSNISDKHVVTRIGVMTAVSDDDLIDLETIDLFKLHQKNGFITVKKKKAAPETVAADMVTRDASAPTTPADLEAEAKQAAAMGMAAANIVKKGK